ncbi:MULTISPECIES: TraR/DksA C4-type zinc finger protein [unclassified Streptomyces]|uniref:TraR/DksA family transcriptional regulator n=1 Tax=unclassified Streptomyces TaxID=2593676 RepID=UPI00336A3A2A
MNGTPPRESPLGPHDLEEAAAKLSDQRDRLRAEIAAARDTESAVRGDCVLDAADAGATTLAIEELHTRTDTATALLDRTLAALTRIQDGTFGTCATCGAPIGRERVMAMPHAERCVACTERQSGP